jgi:NAD(P)-dependent dehydrogenase (short-subunit alcohol dehydrogenase family)
MWDQVMDVNLRGMWLCMKHEVRQMLEQGGGAIVNDSSGGGLRGGRYWGPYQVSKHGVIGLTRVAALEYVRQGIRVNAVCPGFVDTAMTQSFYGDTAGRDAIAERQPAGRHGEPMEVADAVVWLCSDAASFVNGVALPVDGGVMAG